MTRDGRDTATASTLSDRQGSAAVQTAATGPVPAARDRSDGRPRRSAIYFNSLSLNAAATINPYDRPATTSVGDRGQPTERSQIVYLRACLSVCMSDTERRDLIQRKDDITRPSTHHLTTPWIRYPQPLSVNRNAYVKSWHTLSVQ